MENKKNVKSSLLSEAEMKKIKGGHVFTSSTIYAICPICGEWVCLRHSYTLWCPNCGSSINREEKKGE